jgi:hypothetical protein
MRCSADRDRRNGLREGDEDALGPSSPRDPHGGQLHDRTQVHAHGSGRARRSGAGVCTGQDWYSLLQSYVHRRDRRAYGANARHAGNLRGQRGGWPCDRNWVRERVRGCCASDWC